MPESPNDEVTTSDVQTNVNSLPATSRSPPLSSHGTIEKYRFHIESTLIHNDLPLASSSPQASFNALRDFCSPSQTTPNFPYSAIILVDNHLEKLWLRSAAVCVAHHTMSAGPPREHIGTKYHVDFVRWTRFEDQNTPPTLPSFWLSDTKWQFGGESLVEGQTLQILDADQVEEWWEKIHESFTKANPSTEATPFTEAKPEGYRRGGRSKRSHSRPFPLSTEVPDDDPTSVARLIQVIGERGQGKVQLWKHLPTSAESASPSC